MMCAGFIKMLPLIAAALVLGCAKELQGISHADSVVDSWTSYCYHATVETIQRYSYFCVHINYCIFFWVNVLYYFIHFPLLINLLDSCLLNARPRCLICSTRAACMFWIITPMMTSFCRYFCSLVVVVQ